MHKRRKRIHLSGLVRVTHISSESILGDALEFVLLLDGVVVGAALGRVDQLVVGQALGD